MSDEISKKDMEMAEKIIGNHQGSDKTYLKPLPDRAPNVIDPKTLTREQLRWKSNNLQDHLDQLVEGIEWSFEELRKFEADFELNPSKKEELRISIDNMGREIEMVNAELQDVRALL
jgi:hypothetical protein